MPKGVEVFVRPPLPFEEPLMASAAAQAKGGGGGGVEGWKRERGGGPACEEKERKNEGEKTLLIRFSSVSSCKGRSRCFSLRRLFFLFREVDCRLICPLWSSRAWIRKGEACRDLTFRGRLA